LLVILLLAFVFVRADLDAFSPTEDEWAHFTRGVSWWQSGEARLSVAHPPLANVWAGWFVYDDPRLPDVRTLSGWDVEDPGKVALGVLRHDYGAARELLVEARGAMTWIFLFGIAYVYAWCLRWIGFPAAVAAASFVAFNPVCMGQAQYVTTDLASGVAFTVAAGEIAAHLAGGGRSITWLRMPLAVAATVVTKHSGALIVPMVVIAVVGTAALGRGVYAERRPWRRLARAMGHLSFTAVVVLAVDNAAWRFQETGLTVKQTLARPEPQNWITSRYEHRALEEMTPLPSLPPSLRIPVPYAHVAGIAQIRAQNVRGFPHSQFLGDRIPKGHFAYFPTMIASKTPLAIMALLLLGGLVLARKRAWPSLPTLVIAFVGLAYLAVAMRSNLAMGIRHVLPVIWCASILAGIAAQAVWVRLRGQAVARGLLVATVGSVLPVAATAGPDYLGYFNEIVGRELGHRISAVGDDWGQDRAQFVALVQDHGLAPLYYDYQTATRKMEVDHFGLRYSRLRCDTKVPSKSWVAIHVIPYRNNEDRCWPKLRGRTPVFVVNDHILVWWVD
jgi:hypothetical protein